ncbi:MAG: DUF4870 domain-containing protein [Anaerolineales bacterium]|nr:DUF4870 domain-containing protein [Anaerolineales bacterium]MDD5468078.1 DUF4870 domain-containing protein [Anaerolineales bacterium]
MSEFSAPEITSDDKLWSALGYPIPLIAIIVLFMEEKKARPFIKFHAVQSLVFNVALWILIFVVSAVTLGFGAICAPLLWLVTLWPAWESYQGKYLELPVITKFIKNQGWA